MWGKKNKYVEEPYKGSINNLIMSTYTQVLYQIVFGTKNNEQTMINSGQKSFYKYIWGILKNKNLIEYVKNQNKHHKILSFRDEYISLLKEHGIEFNEKYLL